MIRPLTFFLVIFSFVAISYSQPVNDLCAGAKALPTNGTCLNGETTLNATDDFFGTIGCQTTGTNEVWYEYTATKGQINIIINQITMSGDVELMLISSSGGCGGTFTLKDSYCGTTNDTISFDNMFIGSQYFITVNSTQNHGTFDLCAFESTPVYPESQDCNTSIKLCDINEVLYFDTINSGYGLQEISTSNSCWGGGGERQSMWFNFTPLVSGTFEMLLEANQIGFQGDDFDFALFSLVNCDCATDLTSANLVSCNWSAAHCAATGIATDPLTSFGIDTVNATGCVAPAGEAWNPTLTVSAGVQYALLIDNFDISNDGFTISFGGTAIFSCDSATCGTTFGFDTITACDSITWIDNVTYYASSDSIQDTLTNSNGKDSIISLNLTIHQSDNHFDTIQIVLGDSALINGQFQTNNGNYFDTLTTINNCDSIITTTLITSIPTFISRDNALNFSIYPNPTSNTFTIQAKDPIDLSLIKIFNMMGKEVDGYSVSKITSNKVNVKCSLISSGSYLLQYGYDQALIVKN